MSDSNAPYLELITSEHSSSENFIKYTKSTLDMVSPIVNCLDKFDLLFNLDKAIGNQLDILGSLVGISRVLPIDNKDINPVLGDDSYRKVIKAKIMINHWDGTMYGMKNIMSSLFPNIPYDIVDNQDMTMTVYITDPTISEENKALLVNGFILPKPSGVSVNYQIVDSPIFAWDYNSSYLKGWDEGVWS